MAIEDTSRQPWNVETDSLLQCPVCHTTGVTTRMAVRHAGETRIAFRCDHGHTWTLRLEVQGGQTLAVICDLRRRDGHPPGAQASLSEIGTMRRYSEGDQPGAIAITSPDDDNDRKDLTL